jgi:hypothetical protein
MSGVMTEGQQILRSLFLLHKKADILMAVQDDINNAVSVLNGFFTDLSTQLTEIQAMLAAGGATPADTSKLNALITQVPAAQAALDALATPPATPASARA